MYRTKHYALLIKQAALPIVVGTAALTLSACMSTSPKIATAPGTAFKVAHVEQFEAHDEQNFLRIRAQLKSLGHNQGVMWHFAPSRLGLQTSGGVVRIDPDFFAGLSYEAQFFAMAHEWAHIKLHGAQHEPGYTTEIEADDLARKIMQGKGLNACLGILALNQRARNGIGQHRVDRQCNFKVAATD